MKIFSTTKTIAAILTAGLILAAQPAMAATVAVTDEGVVKKGEKDVQFCMFLGTNDKDTNKPVCTEDEALQRAKDILIPHFGGYTIMDAKGGWVGDDGTEYQEFTLVIFVSDAEESEVYEAAEELRVAFNQASVLIQTDEVTTHFYYGEE